MSRREISPWSVGYSGVGWACHLGGVSVIVIYPSSLKKRDESMRDKNQKDCCDMPQTSRQIFQE
jgi:hypothetical protein